MVAEMSPADGQFRNKLDTAIRASIANAARLHEEAGDLEFRRPCATRFFLLIIAQEEAAKAFLLYLIKNGVAPLSAPVRRAINDHACKHLVGMLIDYMIMRWETIEELNELIERDFDLGNNLPDDVGSALEILCYEKIGRWEANNWDWAEDPAYHPNALGLAEGKRDRRKQDALYVRIGSDGQVASTPAVIMETEVSQEFERTREYIAFASALVAREERHGFDQDRFNKVITAFRTVFGTQGRNPA
jgi:AbiV family abortive infection protein